MTPQPTFLTYALKQIERGVTALIGGANLQVRTAPLPRTLARRLGGQLASLEKMLRRVLMLMALALLPGLGPSAPRARPAPKTATKHPENLRRLALLPPPLNVGSEHGFPNLPRACGPVPVEKIFGRITLLQSILTHPATRAKRLARHLQRLMAEGEARPLVLQGPRPKRINRELIMISDGLALRLRTALAVWPNTS